MNTFKPVLTEHINQKDCHTLQFYKSVGGYIGLEKVLKMNPEDVTQEVKDSNLRGRGGAGFSTGVKWGFIPKDSSKPKYLINNADESEPGTFKDRLLMNKAPHQMLGCMTTDGVSSNDHTFQHLMRCFIHEQTIFKSSRFTLICIIYQIFWFAGILWNKSPFNTG